MKLQNTSKFETSELRKLLAIATKGISLVDTGVHVKNSKYSYYGRAYEFAPYISKTRYRRLIVLRLGEGKYPLTHSYPGLKTAPTITCSDWKEMFVCLAAHEARHIQQFKKRWKRSEIDAEKFAIRKLESYRKSKTPAFAGDIN